MAILVQVSVDAVDMKLSISRCANDQIIRRRDNIHLSIRGSVDINLNFERSCVVSYQIDFVCFSFLRDEMYQSVVICEMRDYLKPPIQILR